MTVFAGVSDSLSAWICCWIWRLIVWWFYGFLSVGECELPGMVSGPPSDRLRFLIVILVSVWFRVWFEIPFWHGCSADSVFAWPYDGFPRMVSGLLLSNLQMFLVSLSNANSVHVRVNKREGLHYWVPRSRFWCFGKLVWGDLMLFCFLSSEKKNNSGCRDSVVVEVLMLLRRWLREELFVTAEHLKHYHTNLTKFNHTFSVF